MLVLYGTQGSGSAAAEVALDIAGLDYRKVDAASWKESPGLEELKRVNPLAQIPTLVLDDGSVLSEVAAILLHLGLVASAERPLSPAIRRSAPQQIRGLVYIAANCYAGIGILDYPDRWYPDPDDAVKKAMQARGRARLHELWEIFADQFPATPWLSGERLGALDILAVTVSMWSGARKALAQSRPEFSRAARRASRPIRASPRSGRGTGRSVESRERGECARASSAACARRGRGCGVADRRRRRCRADELVGLINDFRRAPPPCAGKRLPMAARWRRPTARAGRAGEPGRARRGAARRRLSGGDRNLDPRDRPGAAEPRRCASSPSTTAPTARSALLADRRSPAGRLWRINLAKPLLPRRPRRLAPRRAARPRPGQRGAGAAAALRRQPLRRRRRRWPGTKRSPPPPRRTAATWPRATTSATPIPRVDRCRSAPPPPATAGATSARTSPPASASRPSRGRLAGEPRALRQHHVARLRRDGRGLRAAHRHRPRRLVDPDLRPPLSAPPGAVSAPCGCAAARRGSAAPRRPRSRCRRR